MSVGSGEVDLLTEFDENTIANMTAGLESGGFWSGMQVCSWHETDMAGRPDDVCC
jgi:hypothetical protein